MMMEIFEKWTNFFPMIDCYTFVKYLLLFLKKKRRNTLFITFINTFSKYIYSHSNVNLKFLSFKTLKY